MNIYLAPFMLSQMSLKIFLDITSYYCLTEHLSSEEIRSCLSASVMLLGNTRVFDCDEMQAHKLLVIARNHCPAAVRQIKEAMFMAGLTP